MKGNVRKEANEGGKINKNKRKCNKKKEEEMKKKEEVQQPVEEEGMNFAIESTSSPVIESTGLEQGSAKRLSKKNLSPWKEKLKAFAWGVRERGNQKLLYGGGSTHLQGEK